MKGMPDKCVDYVFADIPYDGVNGHSTEKSIRNMDKGDADIKTFELSVFLPLVSNIAKGAVTIFCGVNQVGEIFNFFSRELEWPTRQLIWSKTNPPVINGDKMYLSGVENAVWAKRPGTPFYAKCQTNVLTFPSGVAGVEGKIHPTEKNHKLLGKLIADNTKEGDLVFDPCAGSGSTLFVAGLMGRHYLGCELRKDFYEPANSRLKKTGFQKSLFEE